MAEFTRMVASVPGHERLARHLHAGHVFIHATSAETDGMIGMWDTFSEPGAGPTRHVHVRETEVFRVITGTHRFWCGDAVLDAPPGTTVTLPPNVPHAWKNISDAPGRMFGIVTPGGFEQFFIDLAALDAPSHEEVARLLAKFGVTELPDIPD